LHPASSGPVLDSQPSFPASQPPPRPSPTNISHSRKPGAQECRIQASRVPPTADASSPRTADASRRSPTPPGARCGRAGCHCASAQQPSTSRPCWPARRAPSSQPATPRRRPLLHPRRRPGSMEKPPELSRGQRRWHPLGKLLPVRARGAGPRPRAFVVFSSRRRHHQRLLKVLARAKIF
jgi:hypothetical protein